MKLVQKNLLYTLLITVVLSILVLGYFVFMLPSLYVDYTSDAHFDSIVEQHKQYVEDGTYDQVKVSNPSCFSIDIPYSNSSIQITGKGYQTTITPKSESLEYLVNDVKSFMKSQVEHMEQKELDFDFERISDDIENKMQDWKELLLKKFSFSEELPISIQTVSDIDFYETYMEEESEFHYIDDDTFVFEAGVFDGENRYTMYLGLSLLDDRIVMSYLTAMTPRMSEITPIVLGSLPMILAVIILFALVVSSLYSKGMVDPILRLVKHTEMVKESGSTENASLEVIGKDEIAHLIRTLNHLYEELDSNYKSLEAKNQELYEKNQTQEVFLKASSHQLKTPVSAALLLTDGMIGNIGKYQDRDLYLPQLKKQLLSMKKIVEDILSLGRSEEGIVFEQLNVKTLLEAHLPMYQVMIQEANFDFHTELHDLVVTTDGNLLHKMIDNLLTNAIFHSKPGVTITVKTIDRVLIIENTPAHIEETLLPHIFEPFVSGDTSFSELKHGHGLGLYIVQYYGKLLGIKVDIMNTAKGVEARLYF